MPEVYYSFIYTTQAKYDALKEKDAGGLYFISDTHRIYRGEELISANNVIISTTIPEASSCFKGIIYLVGSGTSYLPYVLSEDGTSMVKIVPEVPEVANLDLSVFASGVVTTAIDEENAADTKVATEKAIVDYVKPVKTDLASVKSDVDTLKAETPVTDVSFVAASGGTPSSIKVTKKGGTTSEIAVADTINGEAPDAEKLTTESAVTNYVASVKTAIEEAFNTSLEETNTKVNGTFKSVSIGDSSDTDAKKFGLVFTKVDGTTTTIDLQKEAFLQSATLRHGEGGEAGKVYLDLVVLNGDTHTIDLSELVCDASTVKTTRKIVTTVAVGNYAKGTEIDITDLQSFLENMLSQDIDPTVTAPSVSLTAPQNKEYEVGTKVTPTYTATFNAGSYSQTANNDQVATGVTVESWSVTNGTDTLTTASGTFDEITVADDSNYVITATATHTAGNTPKTYLGKDCAEKAIAAGTKSKSSSAIKGYRKQFLGWITTDASAALDSNTIRGLSESKKAAKGAVTFTVPTGATKVIVAYPKTFTSAEPTFEYMTLGWTPASGFTSQEVEVEGLNGAAAVTYTVYTYTPAVAYAADTQYRITIK